MRGSERKPDHHAEARDQHHLDEVDGDDARPEAPRLFSVAMVGALPLDEARAPRWRRRRRRPSGR